jgi:guanine deaminase
MGGPLIFHGTVIHSLSVSELAVHKDTLLVVEAGGTIELVEPDVAKAQVPQLLASLGISEKDVRYLEQGQFIIPGFVDTHNHAPQWAQRGLGQSMHILDWLDKVTFPNEARFRDPVYARRIYSSCIDGFLRQGVTTASYYGSMHLEATKVLAELCMEKGQRAFVGKCNSKQS